LWLQAKEAARKAQEKVLAAEKRKREKAIRARKVGCLLRYWVVDADSFTVTLLLY